MVQFETASISALFEHKQAVRLSVEARQEAIFVLLDFTRKAYIQVVVYSPWILEVEQGLQMSFEWGRDRSVDQQRFALLCEEDFKDGSRVSPIGGDVSNMGVNARCQDSFAERIDFAKMIPGKGMVRTAEFKDHQQAHEVQYWVEVGNGAKRFTKFIKFMPK
eukprot:TRINITY_DN5006_c1_g1_i1.p1 TRINITY_DN5006_c1_g1~~TRINITY_DN5006_c1_g1_i1.p1  ORF type:complete len:162 (-),score=38.88 TRINITY_DN5006_c1_g1_i1:60-545(-)